MNVSASPIHAAAPRRAPWRALTVWLLAVGFVSAVVAVPYAIVQSLTLDRDARELRDAVTGSFAIDTGHGWSRLVEVRAGGCLLGLARLVAGCTDLPVEARQALRAARSASVGVYQNHGGSIAKMRERMSRLAGTVHVAGRDWTRLVSVRQSDASVIVLTPAGVDLEDELLELCVVVLAEGELVVVSAEIDLEPIRELIQPYMRDLRCELNETV